MAISLPASLQQLGLQVFLKLGTTWCSGIYLQSLDLGAFLSPSLGQLGLLGPDDLGELISPASSLAPQPHFPRSQLKAVGFVAVRSENLLVLRSMYKQVTCEMGIDADPCPGQPGVNWPVYHHPRQQELPSKSRGIFPSLWSAYLPV